MGGRVRPADHSVILEQNRVVVLDERQHRLGKSLRSGSLIGSHGSRTDEYLVFGNQPVGRRGAGDGKGCGVGRMTMHHGAGLGVRLVNLQVQQQFAGTRAFSGQNIALQVQKTDVRQLQVALAQHGGRAEHVARAEARADVPSVAINILPLPQLAAHADNLRAHGLGLEGVGNSHGRFFFRLQRARNLRHGLRRSAHLFRNWNRCLLHGKTSRLG